VERAGIATALASWGRIDTVDSANTPGLVLGRAEIAALRRRWLAEESAAFTGWDFSLLAGRMTSEATPWDYLTVHRCRKW